MGSDVVHFCQHFMQLGVLPTCVNDTNIILIPKKKGLETMSDLRPIALCNVLYRILAKVMANRLRLVLPCLISNTQSAFILGRSIVDNLLIAFEVNHYLKRKQ